jgi:hypothetical protein
VALPRSAAPSSVRAALLSAVALVAVAACASDGTPRANASSLPPGEGRSVVVGTVAPCVPPSAIPFGDVTSKLPPGLRFPPGSRLLEVDVAGGVTTIVGESSAGIGQLHARFRAQLVAAGRDVFAEDNEGIEAELFFTIPGGGLGVVRETKARCPVGVTRFSFSLN